MKKVYLLSGLLCLLTFTNIFAQCTITNATTCSCAQSGSTNCDLLPDIIVGKPPLLVSGSNGVIEYSQTGNGVENGRLRVSVSSPNIGFGPLEIRAQAIYICGTDTFYGTSPGTCPTSGLAPKQLITQRVYHKNGNIMTNYDRPAGSMTYHPSHGHMHVDDWGIYSLRTATSDPNPLNWPVIGTGAKLAFCLMDYGSCSGYSGHCVDSLGNVLLNGNFPNYGLGGGSYNCSAVIQGISSGYTDIYYQYLDGMYLTIPPNTCNGSYYIVVQLDPYNYFLESNEGNNVIAIPYTLTQQGLSLPAITASGPTTFCPGGSVTLSTIAGGTSYLWSTGATTQSIIVTAAGSYNVTVTGASCSGTTSPINVVVNGLPAVATITNGSICAGQSTQLNASATTSGYTNLPSSFSTIIPVAIPDNNAIGVTSPISVSGISPASLTATSIQSVNINITHTYDGDLIVSLISPSGNTITLSNRRGGSGDNFTNTTFSMGASTTIASGTAPFNGSYIPDGSFSALTGNANGVWQLKVADVAGTDVGTIVSWTLTLNSQIPNGISYSWSSNPAGFSSSLTNPVITPSVSTTYLVTATDLVTGCIGSASVSVNVNQLPTAIISPVSPVCLNDDINLILNSNGNLFSWVGPNNFVSGSANPVISNATLAASGNYTVTVSNTAGCSVTASVNASVINPPIVSSLVTQIACNGAANGAIDLTITNGLGVTYLWSNGATTQDLTGLAPGNYSVTVSKVACVVNTSFSVTEPTALSCVCNAVVSNVTCFNGTNGSITPQITGGSLPYSYLWSNAQTTQTAGGLTAGTYTVTITDANNCIISGSASVTQPAALSLSAITTPVNCSGVSNGAINLTTNGGTSPYTYLWSNGSTTKNISSLSVGSYTVTVTDNCGSVVFKSATISQLPSPFTLAITKTNIRCSGIHTGVATANVIGGTGPFTYSWNTIPVQTTASISGLSSKTYVVVVTDVFGCTKQGSVYISHPTAITALVSQTNASFPGAFDGAISLAVSGGTGPYTYNWNTIPVKTTATITGLSAGIYKCTIKDSKLCSKKVTVTITQPSALGPGNNNSILLDKSKIDFRVTPNPSRGLIEWSYRSPVKGEATLSLADLIGKTVFTKKVSLVKGLNINKLDLSLFNKGIYFIRIEQAGNGKVIKLILD